MKQIKKRSIAMYITFAILIVFLTGAECSIGGCSVTFNDYTGKAVNVKAAGTTASYWKVSDTITLENAVVSLYAYDSTTDAYSGTAADTATVGSTGTFSFFALEPNMYKLSAVKTGWTFVPRYIEISDSGTDFPDLMAYPTANAGQITIITSWKDTTIDVDSIITYGPISDTTKDWTADTANPTNLFRNKIYWDAIGSTDGIKLDRDVASDTYGDLISADTIPRVETISIYNSDWLTSGDVLFFYLDAFFDDEEDIDNDLVSPSIPIQSLTGMEGTYASAYAQVDVMFGTEHYGTWVLPWNTSEDTLKILAIDYNTDETDTFTGAADFAISSEMANADEVYGGIKSIIWE